MGIFSHSKCPTPDGADDYHHDHARNLMLYIAAACTAITFCTSVALITTHLRRYRCPKEQRQIVRICFAPFVFAAVAFFEILSYQVAPYIDPIGDLYEAFGLCALFLLYLQFAAPGGTFSEEMFEQVKMSEEGEHVAKDWPRLTWIIVFQYPLTQIVATLVLEITEALDDYCVQSLSPKYGHLWYTIIQSVGVGACVLAIIRFYGHVKNRLKARRGLMKLLVFKVIVGLRFLQSLIFSILLDHNVIKPSEDLTYNDILYGIENVLLCAEMAVIAACFWYAYSSSEYSSDAKPRDRPLPLYKAILHAINPMDLFVGIGRLFVLITHLQRGNGSAQNSAMTANWGGGPQRYQTGDNMEPLSRPGVSHGRQSSQFETSYQGNGQHLYQPPSGSPPTYSYNEQSSHLMAGPRRAESPEWDGQRYNRSISPGGRYTEGREMV